jgi:NFU1 iron-sulfur cluster scaffold homolog, mitochondrial
VEWIDIQDQLKTHIREYLEAEKPVLIKADPLQNDILDSDPDVVKNIKSVLEEYIKPAVESDGGAIVFQDFEDGVVKVALQGSCSGCPSSMVTLKAGIENLLKRMVPEVQSVEAVSL